MWNTLHGRFMERTLDDRQAPRVAEHLEPILIPIALVFYLWDDVRAILIVQTIAIALGALPVYWIARDHISNSKYQYLPLAFAFVYLMFPALQAANVADFHADPLVVAPFLFAFWYATQGRYRAMWGWALLAMLVKETLPTLTFMLGLYLVLSRGLGNQESGIRESGNRERLLSDSLVPDSPLSHPLLTHRRLHGLALMLVSLAWFCVATFVIVAPLAGQVYGSQGPIYFSSRFAGLGDGLSGLVGALGDPERLRYVAGLLASVGWLALLAPEYLLLGLPVLAANMLSNFPGQYSGEQHYSAPLAPIFVIAAIYGFQRLSVVASQHFPATARRRYGAMALVLWLLVWSLGYHTLRGWTPLARDFVWPQRTAHHRLLARFADQIPADARLSTTPPLHPHLAHRQKIYVFPTLADADFVLLDVAGRTDAHPSDVRATFDGLLASGEFGVVDAADGYVLLSRRARIEVQAQALPDAFYDFARAGDARPQIPARVDFQQLRLLGYDVVDDLKWRQTYVRLYWQTLAPVPEGLRLWPLIYDEAGLLIEDTSQRPMVVPLWYPPARWKVGETVVTEMLPWDLGPRFNVGLAALLGAEGASPEMPPGAAFTRPEMRMPVTATGPGVVAFHGDSWVQLGAFARQGRELASASERPALLPLKVSFGEGIRLTGYRISNLQSPISVVLEWEATRPISRDYTVFVHLVAADGEIVSQSDAQPAWVVPWPTDRWRPDQPVLDGHQLPLPPDLAPGRYLVQVGLYTWESLERLPVLDDSMQPVGDHVVLQEIPIDF
jgi:uncharacterized membrane protein